MPKKLRMKNEIENEIQKIRNQLRSFSTKTDQISYQIKKLLVLWPDLSFL